MTKKESLNFGNHIFLILSIIIAISYDTAYGETKFTIEPNVGKLSGYTLYNISGTEYLEDYGYFEWASELEWPIDSIVAGLNLAVNVDDTFAVELGARKNLDKYTGKIEDSDYIEGYKVIYSESDTEMKMLDLNLSGKFNVYKDKENTLGIIGGFRYQDFYFEASNVRQWSISPELTGSVPGLAATYKVKYSVPFLGIWFNSRLRETIAIDLAAKLGYVIAEDEDDHVLRYKKSTGKSTGYSIGLSGGLIFNFTPTIFMRLDGEYQRIETEGKQTQTWYATTEEAPAGTTYKDIDLKLESSQTLVTLGIGVRF